MVDNQEATELDQEQPGAHPLHEGGAVPGLVSGRYRLAPVTGAVRPAAAQGCCADNPGVSTAK